ncbi:hypothetical protein [Sphingomonas daechungensis]|uniref:hypothetical protein n=1 Tax=Sphingomonas daechungensis TaxID=1176646 RepID=UPI0037849D51
MTDKPIIFSAPMVRALLDGRKTMTRRALKPQPIQTENGYWKWHLPDGASGYPEDVFRTKIGRWHPLPYAVGDRIWVRERAFIDGKEVNYAADCPPGLDISGFGYRPSIHMPRWASRITLIVESVKVERVRDISDEDARAEGIFARSAIGDDPTSSQWTWQKDSWRYDTPRDAFQALWNSIHGPKAWDENPWVVAITFRVIRANIDSVEASQ